MIRPGGVLFLAADACDARIVEQLVEQGELPTFRRLFETAARVETRAPEGLFVGAVWPSLTTGLHADRHGYYTWLAPDETWYEMRQTSLTEARGTPLWYSLLDAGQRSVILDVPHMRIDDEPRFDGVLLAEWGCHDRHLGPASHPPDLVDDLNARFGRHYAAGPSPGFEQHAPCDYLHRAGHYRTPEEERLLLETFADGHRRKAAASLSLLDQEACDLYLVVFGETHCAGHQLWHVHDESHPRHDPQVRRALGDPVVEMYRRVDATIGEHLAAVGDDVTAYVLLPHGMLPHYDGTLVLDHLLARLWQVENGDDRPGWRTRAGSTLSTVRLPDRLRALSGWLTARALRRRLAAHPPPVATGHTSEGLVGDAEERAGRAYFQIPNNSVSGAIRFNIIGRDPRGVVDPGSIDELSARLTAYLSQVINVDTGEPIVEEVVRTDSIYRRTPEDRLPDLLVEWNRRHPIARVWSPRTGTLVVPYDHWRTGDHHADGLLFAVGAGIQPGRRPALIEVEAIAPTVCASLGFEQPDTDGRPVSSLVATQPEHAAAEKAKIGS